MILVPRPAAPAALPLAGPGGGAAARTFLLVGVLMMLAALPAPAQSGAGTTMSREQVIAAGEQVADAQLAAFKGRLPGIGWVPGVMWTGYADFTRYSSRPEYPAALTSLGERVHWTPGHESHMPHHADDLVICQAFLEMYARTRDPAILAPTRSRVAAASDYMLGQEPPGKLNWWWCDALFMGAPVQARLSAVTGDPKYLAALDAEWARTRELLYDQEEHLFFRDAYFLKHLTRNEKKILWSRGNGWVFAGLSRLLPYVPASDPARAGYVTIFKDMAARLASLQQPDGTWRPSLLDPEEYPDSETSGTALDCSAFAWGINNKVLDAGTYLPVVSKAWAALLAARMPDGLLGYVQTVAGSPGLVAADAPMLYATGQFLLAAGQVSLLAPIRLPPLPKLTTEPPPPPTPSPTPAAGKPASGGPSANSAPLTAPASPAPST